MNIRKTILAVGSLAVDTIETPNGNRKNLLGGSANYFAVAANLLTSVKIVGVVGDDYPEEGWQMFQSRGINADNIAVQKGETFRWGGKYNHDYSKRKTLYTKLGVFDGFKPSIKNEDENSPLVFLGNIKPDLQLCVAGRAVSAEHIVSDTMNLWIDLYPEELKQVFSKSSILLINDEEAEQFTGEKKLSLAGQRLRSIGPKIVVIKRGAKGAFLSFDEQEVLVPSVPVNQLLDPTGAGDSFAGGFLGRLAQTNESDIIEAVVFGSAVASFCVEGFGLSALLAATRSELSGRVDIIKNLLFEKDFK